ncbi:hypothetical protein PSm6_34400 [Pseudomonas solani]|uniref:DUF3509 domain-containing protein n=1 Tax=Pseudomonas solani TaxID=2731552 RepID=A0AAU7Y7J0_9PSED|nr:MULTISPECIES: DUF3509 domain-containing protein [Pseudomonas]EQM70048.1 hypothetical protein L682_11290 [Pseudomonas alcaligenes OT 69]MBB4822259.1 hypothetical protein [Pseudomonas alcaligenes]MDN4148757.1 DUF3509 domain-containing protein [Pseudomonas tohonis]MDU9414838.1 DUF3509 domain-containing protein [Pseudomonas sp. zfem005]WCD81861.1 DUF3509 domain-containing protein [Pseudomonas sp. TUM22785]
MQIAIKEFFDAFPGFEVSIKPRPDGMLLLTLGKQGEAAMSKAIQSDAVFCKERVRGLIRDVMREMKLASGEVTWKGEGNIWLTRELPTFTGGPIQMTAAKTLVERRKLERQSNRRALVS